MLLDSIPRRDSFKKMQFFNASTTKKNDVVHPDSSAKKTPHLLNVNDDKIYTMPYKSPQVIARSRSSVKQKMRLNSI